MLSNAGNAANTVAAYCLSCDLRLHPGTLLECIRPQRIPRHAATHTKSPAPSPQCPTNNPGWEHKHVTAALSQERVFPTGSRHQLLAPNSVVELKHASVVLETPFEGSTEIPFDVSGVGPVCVLWCCVLVSARGFVCTGGALTGCRSVGGAGAALEV